VEQKVVLRGHR